MKLNSFVRISIGLVLIAGVGGLQPNWLQAASAKQSKVKPESAPKIQIDEIPSADGGGPEKFETIAGSVSGVKLDDCKVVVYAFANAWYVQPFEYAPDTKIRATGKWRTEVHLGSQYAALLVRSAYRPLAYLQVLPNTGGDVLAVTVVAGRRK